MPWPPTLPPATRANATVMLDTHAADHNQMATALSTLSVRGTYTPWRSTSIAGPVNPGSTGTNTAVYTRIGNRVFVDTCLSIAGTGASGGTGALLHTLPFPIAPSAYPVPAGGVFPRGGSFQIGGMNIAAAARNYLGVIDMANPNYPRIIYIDPSTAIATYNVLLCDYLTNNALVVGQFSYVTDA